MKIWVSDMRPEILDMLRSITDENIMTSFIKRLTFEGSWELLDYIEWLEDSHKERWLEAYNKAQM